MNWPAIHNIRGRDAKDILPEQIYVVGGNFERPPYNGLIILKEDGSRFLDYDPDPLLEILVGQNSRGVFKMIKVDDTRFLVNALMRYDGVECRTVLMDNPEEL